MRPARLLAPLLICLCAPTACQYRPPPVERPRPVPVNWSTEPLDLSAQGVLVVLAAPDPGGAPSFLRELRGDLARLLAARVETRLPEATLIQAAPTSVREARRWIAQEGPRVALGVRAEEAICGDSRRSGLLAHGSLTLVVGAPGASEPRLVRIRRSFPDLNFVGMACMAEIVTRLFEDALEQVALVEALTSYPPAELRGAVWSSKVVRALFTELDLAIQEWIVVGNGRLVRGRLEAAAEAFRAAARIDPEHPWVRSYLTEVEATLALRRELEAASHRDVEDLEELSSGLRRHLAEEGWDHDALVAAFERKALRLAERKALASFRPHALPGADTPGVRLARARIPASSLDRALEARALWTPEGELLAIFYFRVGQGTPLLREEDTNGDGKPDRWVGYGVPSGDSESARPQDASGLPFPREIWEDRDGRGAPDFFAVLSPDGVGLERVEIDADLDGRPEQIFSYSKGQLASEARDTTGDGSLDRFESFDEKGLVSLREEDRDGDGRIDIRSHYRKGRLVSREIEDPMLTEID